MKLSEREKEILTKLTGYHFKKAELLELYQSLYFKKKCVSAATANYGEAMMGANGDFRGSKTERNALNIIEIEERIQALDLELWAIQSLYDRLPSGQEKEIIFALMSGIKMSAIARGMGLDRRKAIKLRNQAIRKLSTFNDTITNKKAGKS